MNDADIIKLYLSRDERAVEETARSYGALCRSVAKGILASDEDIEECLNDTYLALWRSIPPNISEKASAYFAAVARRTALRRVEHDGRQKRSPTLQLSLDELGEVADDGICDTLDAQETARLVGEFLKGGKKTVRCVFIRRYYFLDTVADIARMYSCSESKVKNMLWRCRKRLREYLLRAGVSL